MNNLENSNHDRITNDPLVTPDGLEPDAAPPNSTPADPTVHPADQPIEAARPEAPGTPDADPEPSESSDPPAASQPIDAQPTNPPASGAPEAPAPPSTNEPAPKTKQPRAKRPHSPDRVNNLLKTDREGIGGPATDAGKATSSMNNCKHGMYSRGPFRVMPFESQEAYDALCERMRRQYPPIDEASEQMLDLLTQAFWRFARCDRAEYMAETADPAHLEKYQRGIFGVSSYRTRCERSYYLHYEKLKRLFADYKQQQAEILEKMQAAELEKQEEEAKPKPRFNEAGEEMDPDYPQVSIWKISCLPDSQCNERFEFDRTLAGKTTVKRTPLRDWEGGWMLHPSIKPRTMKGEWPDYALGKYKDYYNSRKAEDIKNFNEETKDL